MSIIISVIVVFVIVLVVLYNTLISRKNQVSNVFARGRVHVAISRRKNLFEPRVFRTLLNFSPIKRYFEDLGLAIGIADELNLNTRIWSKVKQ